MIKNFIPLFDDCTDKMIAILKLQEQNLEVDILSITSRCSLTMVLGTSLGLNAPEVQFSDEMLKAVQK
jgi:hypothetical protein